MNAPDRLVFLESGRGIGGPVAFLCYLAKYLDRSRFEPIVIFYRWNDDATTRRLRDLGVTVAFVSPKQHESGPLPFTALLAGSTSGIVGRLRVVARTIVELLARDVPMAIRTFRVIRKHRPRLVMLNNDAHYHVAGILAARFARLPCVCRKAGGIGEGRVMKRVLTPMIDMHIAVSTATAQDQLALSPGTRRMELVPEGVDPSSFTRSDDDVRGARALRRELDIAPGALVVACVARVEAGKGQREFVEMAAIAARHSPGAVFVVFGDASIEDRPVMDALRARALAVRNDCRIIFAGWRDDVASVFASIDVFVHCPTTFIEGLSIATLEAMASSLPMLVSANGGLTDTVSDGESGTVVAPGDVKAMAAAVVRYCSDETLRRRHGAGARARLEWRFDIRRNVRQMEGLFDEVIAR